MKLIPTMRHVASHSSLAALFCCSLACSTGSSDAGLEQPRDGAAPDAGPAADGGPANNDAGAPDAGVEPEDAGLPDGGLAAGGEPILYLTSNTYSPSLGETVTVSWNAQNVVSCTVETSLGDAVTGTSGSLDVVIDDLTFVVARCDPRSTLTIGVLSLAPRCEETIEVQTLNNADDLAATECFSVTLGVVAEQPDVRLARVQHSGDNLFFFHTGPTGLLFPNLETLGPFGLTIFDYQNNVGPPGGLFFESIGFDTFYLSFPKFESELNLFVGQCGRVDAPQATEIELLIIGPQTSADFGPCDRLTLSVGTPTFGSVQLSNTDYDRAPAVLGTAIGVDGDVLIRDNPSLPHAEAMAFVERLGPVAGLTQICGNLDDAPCP